MEINHCKNMCNYYRISDISWMPMPCDALSIGIVNFPCVFYNICGAPEKYHARIFASSKMMIIPCVFLIILVMVLHHQMHDCCISFVLQRFCIGHNKVLRRTQQCQTWPFKKAYYSLCFFNNSGVFKPKQCLELLKTNWLPLHF